MKSIYHENSRAQSHELIEHGKSMKTERISRGIETECEGARERG